MLVSDAMHREHQSPDALEFYRPEVPEARPPAIVEG